MTNTSVEVVYQLAVPLLIQEEVWGTQHGVQLAGFDGIVVVPGVTWRDDGWAGLVAPPLRGPNETEHTAYVAEPWGTVLTVTTESQSFNAAWLNKLLVRFENVVVHPRAFHTNRIEGNNDRLRIDPLLQAVSEWWDGVLRWVAVLADHDTEESALGSTRSSQLAMWTIADDRTSGPVTMSLHSGLSGGLRGGMEVLSLATIASAFRLAAKGAAPPAEHSLLADARSMVRRSQYRRAVIDAATACELALYRLLETELAGLSPRTRDAILGEHRTLGRLVTVLGGSHALPSSLIPHLVAPRNAAMHRNEQIDRLAATRAIEIVTAVVDLVEPLSSVPD